MRKLISIILVAAVSFSLAGCADDANGTDSAGSKETVQSSAPKSYDGYEKNVGDLVFMIPNDTVEVVRSQTDYEPYEYDHYSFTKYADDEKETYHYVIQIMTAVGDSAKDLYNNDVEMYSDINAWYDDFYEKYPDTKPETRIYYDTVTNDLPDIDGLEYQIGSYWTLTSRDTNTDAYLISFIADDTYYSISFLSDPAFDSEIWNSFVSSIRKL